MARNLLQEYADLTRQMQDIARRRNEIGAMLERERKTRALADAQADEKAVIDALVKVAESKPPKWDAEDWGDLADRLDVTTWRLSELFQNLLLRVRRQFPDHGDVIPHRVGPRTLATWSEWGKLVKKYKAAL